MSILMRLSPPRIPTGETRQSRRLFSSALWLIPPLVVGVVCALSFWGSVLLAIVIVVAFCLSVRLVTPLDLLVISAPLMFFSPVTGSLHLALSDLVYPCFLLFLAGSVTWTAAIAAASPLIRYSAGVVGLLCLSVAMTSWTDPGFLLSAGLSNAMKLVVGFAYAIAVAMWVGTRAVEDVFRTLRLWTWVATFMSLGSVLTQLNLLRLVPTDGTRSLGFFQDPNLYAGYLLLSMTLVLVVEAYRQQRSTVLQLLVIAAGVVATGSRGAVATLALLVVVATLRLSIRRIRFALLAVATGALGIVTALVNGTSVLPVVPALGRLAEASQTLEADPRLGLWARAISLWESDPIIGVGIGQFGRFSVDVYGISSDTGLGYIAHNSFLSFLAELGIAGFALSVLGLVWLVVKTNRIVALPLNVRRALNLGLLSVVAEMMTLNLQNVRYVWIYIGVTVGLIAWGRLQAAGDDLVPAEHGRVLSTMRRD